MKKLEKIEKFLSELETEIDILNYVNVETVDTFTDILEQIDLNNGFDIEIIYYYNAINYLKENDPSLQESLEIASELGYTADNLNSEILASLLASKNAVDSFYELENEIDDFFNELESE